MAVYVEGKAKVRVDSFRSSFSNNLNLPNIKVEENKVFVDGKLAFMRSKKGKLQVNNFNAFSSIASGMENLTAAGLSVSDLLYGKIVLPDAGVKRGMKGFAGAEKVPVGAKLSRKALASDGQAVLKDAAGKDVCKVIAMERVYAEIEAARALLKEAEQFEAAGDHANARRVGDFALEKLSKRIVSGGYTLPLLELLVRLPETHEREKFAILEDAKKRYREFEGEEVPFSFRMENGRVECEFTGKPKQLDSALDRFRAFLLEANAPPDVFNANEVIIQRNGKKMRYEAVAAETAASLNRSKMMLLGKGYAREKESIVFAPTLMGLAQNEVEVRVDGKRLKVSPEKVARTATKAFGSGEGERFQPEKEALLRRIVEDLLKRGLVQKSVQTDLVPTRKGINAAKVNPEIRRALEDCTGRAAWGEIGAFAAVAVTASLVAAFVAHSLAKQSSKQGEHNLPPADYVPRYNGTEVVDFAWNASSNHFNVKINGTPFDVQAVDFGGAPAKLSDFVSKILDAKDLHGNTVIIGAPSNATAWMMMLDSAADMRVKVAPDVSQIPESQLVDFVKACAHPAVLFYIASGSDAANAIKGVQPDAKVFLKVDGSNGAEAINAQISSLDPTFTGVVVEPGAGNLSALLEGLNASKVPTFVKTPSDITSAQALKDSVYQIENTTAEAVITASAVKKVPGLTSDWNPPLIPVQPVGPGYINASEVNASIFALGGQYLNLSSAAENISAEQAQLCDMVRQMPEKISSIGANISSIVSLLQSLKQNVSVEIQPKVAEAIEHAGGVAGNLSSARDALQQLNASLQNEIVNVSSIAFVSSQVQTVIDYLNSHPQLNETDLNTMQAMLAQINASNALNRDLAFEAKTYAQNAQNLLAAARAGCAEMLADLNELNSTGLANVSSIISQVGVISSELYLIAGGPSSPAQLAAKIDNQTAAAEAQFTQINQKLDTVNQSISLALATLARTQVIDDFESNPNVSWIKQYVNPGVSLDLSQVEDAVSGARSMRITYTANVAAGSSEGPLLALDLGLPINLTGKIVKLKIRHSGGDLPTNFQVLAADASNGVSRYNITPDVSSLSHVWSIVTVDFSNPPSEVGVNGPADLTAAKYLKFRLFFDGGPSGRTFDGNIEVEAIWLA